MQTSGVNICRVQATVQVWIEFYFVKKIKEMLNPTYFNISRS